MSDCLVKFTLQFDQLVTEVKVELVRANRGLHAIIIHNEKPKVFHYVSSL